MVPGVKCRQRARAQTKARRPLRRAANAHTEADEGGPDVDDDRLPDYGPPGVAVTRMQPKNT